MHYRHATGPMDTLRLAFFGFACQKWQRFL
jgi:hypothetical protein